MLRSFHRRRFSHRLAATILAVFLAAPHLAAQVQGEPPVDPGLLQALEWRLIGPFRGGRVTTVTGVRGQPLTYYFGATGGGVWKSDDAGTAWRNVSDGHLGTGSVGAVAVAESDPNVVYAGMGEAQVRGVASSHGDGVYRSTDGGRTWKHLGLSNTRQISRIRVHPDHPDLVYVAAQGNRWKPNRERGIYRSRDGGQTWLRILYVDDRSGASDLAMDPANPRILYAAFWQHRRHPWKIESGGPGSGLYKSTDGGDSWEELEKGLPEAMGKIGVAVSPARAGRVWAIVEAEDGGLFRSDDGGESWRLVNRDRLLRARAWYYTKVFADPRDPDTVWVANAPLLRSVDGGKTFERVPTPHGDNHDLWIDPDDPRRMINGNDGGANVSWNGGATWSSQSNQPTGQFYRVITDRRFPYRIYGGQQDNSTVSIATRSPGRGIGREDWYPVGGCESAFVAFNPDDPRRVYAGCYQGLISEYDVATRQQREIMAYPYLGLGSEPRELEYRFNWNAPIVVSPHDPGMIYHAGNVVLRSTDRGLSWQAMSPDLTRDQVDKQGPGGGPITNEAAGGETYNTLTYLVESPHQAGVLWVGSDDGLVHRSGDAGESWVDVTPPQLAGDFDGEALINAIEISPHDPATVYLAVARHRFGDLTPHIFKTVDDGVTWERRVEGLPDESFVRVVREDPARPGLLYAGTETGLHVSFDGGERWQPFQGKLPVVPITDLALRDSDLVASTQGRAFWALDDLTPLHQLSEEIAASDVHLFEPRAAVRFPGGDDGEPPENAGRNPPNGAILYYALSEQMVADLERGTVPVEPEESDEPEESETSGEPGPSDEPGTSDTSNTADTSDLSGPFAEPAEPDLPFILELEILDAAGEVIRRYSNHQEENDPIDPPPDSSDFGFAEPEALPVKAGLNRFVWDLRGEQVSRVSDLHVLYPRAKTYRVAPGEYQVRLKVGEVVQTRPLTVLPDLRTSLTPESYAEQIELVAGIWHRVDGIHSAVELLRDIRVQVQALINRLEAHPTATPVIAAGEALVERIDTWQEDVVQRRQETFQDVINFPNRLNAQLLFLLDTIDRSEPPVTEGARRRFVDLEAEWLEHEAVLREILDTDVPDFNRLVDEYRVPAVIVPPE